MKAQISRDTHDPRRRYSGVIQQQGRMITDADWNDLVALLQERVDRAVGDVVGSGVPRRSRLRVQVGASGVELVPGAVFVDGIRAELPGEAPVPFASQPDFPRAPPVPANAVIYADVWERLVISLQDPALRDPGLHGADTCARTQTMVQLKWCAPGVNPASPAVNPPIGDAVLSTQLWDNSAAGERGDPCLTETAEQQRIGNYLFRVEVHHVEWKSANDLVLTLGWSSENGAEQQSLVRLDAHGNEQIGYDVLPPEFTAGHWRYEVFTDASEKQLGHHLAAGFAPVRGALLDELTGVPPAIGGETARYVRRWDGGCTIRLVRAGAGSPWRPVALDGGGGAPGVQGVDKGQPLRTDTPGHGYVEFPSAGGAYRLRASLEGLIIELALGSGAFLAGDHWLVVVREGAEYIEGTSVDQRVVVLGGGKPIGVRHHYLELAQVSGGAIAPYVAGSPEARRLDFPPLTNLTADRIGYDATGASVGARWDDINEPGGARRPLTVQEAIDDLVLNFESTDVGCVLPPCEKTSYGALTFNKQLQPHIAGLTVSGGKSLAKLDALLDALLCSTDASLVPYDPTRTGSRWADVAERIWAVQMGGVKDDVCNGVAVDSDGSVVVVGSFQGTAAFGDQVLTSAGDLDAFLVRLDPSGKVSWAKRFGGAAAERGMAVAIGPDRSILVAGRFLGHLDLGGGSQPLDSTAPAGFVAKFGTSGACVWARSIGGVDEVGRRLAVDRAGNVAVTGYLYGALTVDGLPVLSSDGGADVFLVKLDANGTPAWSKRFGSTDKSSNDRGFSAVADGEGNILLVGDTGNGIDFGGGQRLAAGDRHLFVAKLGPSGTHVWSKVFGSMSPVAAVDLTAQPGTNDVLVTGFFGGQIDFGGGQLVGASGYETFVVKLGGKDGSHLWSRRFSGTSNELGTGIAAEASGRTVVMGYFSGTVDFGRGALTSPALDAFVVVLGPDGQTTASAQLGAHAGATAQSLALAPDGGVVLGGYFSGTTEFAGEPLTSAGGYDVFVTKLMVQSLGPTTVQEAVDALATQLDGADLGYAVPNAGASRDSVRKRLPSLADLANGAPTRVARVLDALLCELDAGSIPFTARDPAGPAGSVAELMVKKIGDTVTGPLVVAPASLPSPTSPALEVRGILSVRGLELTADPGTPDKAVLSYDKASGLAKWMETALAAWSLHGGNLATVPSAVTGAVNIGAVANALVVARDGKVGIGTVSPAVPLHVVSQAGSGYDTSYGVPGLDGKHIAVGATQMWGLKDAYGTLLTWDTDSMFVGLKNEGSNRKDAVIGWGDDKSDALRFMFAAGGSPPSATEVMKLSAAGDLQIAGSLTVPGDLTVGRIRGKNNLVLSDWRIPSPASNVYLYSPPGDRDAWIYLDSADTGRNWGIYHRQIDQEFNGLPRNSIAFVGKGEMQAYVCLEDGSAQFKGNVGVMASPGSPRSGWSGGIHTWDIYCDGAGYSKNSFNSKAYDLAENFEKHEAGLEPGDVIVADRAVGERLVRSRTAYDGLLLGVVSEAPGFLLGVEWEEGTDPIPLALAGRVPVKVNLEGGAIRIGDLLTSSSEPGVAMKATKAGRVLGMALGPFDGTAGSSGKVVVLVNPHWWGGSSR